MKAKLPPWTRFCSALALAAAALSLTAASATAEIPFCTYGSEPGQCKEPTGVAVDTTLGRVYVADPGNNRVEVFDEEGNFLSSFGTLGTGNGELTGPRRVAVDNDSTGPNFGDVYVTDGSPRVQRFSSAGAYEATIGAGTLNRSNPQIAVIPGGDLYVVDSVGGGAELENRQVKIFDAAGALVGSSTIGGGSVADVAVDSTGDVYVIHNNAIEKYETSEPTATLLASYGFEPNARALAVDSTDNLYIAEINSNERELTKRDPSGNVVKRFGYGEIIFNLQGIVVGPEGDLFASEIFNGFSSTGEVFGNQVIRIAQPGPGAVPCCLKADLGNTKATLEGKVNPGGKESTYHFEYLSEAEYEANGNDFEGPNEPAETPESDPVAPVDPEDPGKELPPATDFVLYPAEAEIGCATPEDPPQPECLTPGTAYRYRLVATNADGENSVEGQFTTKRPFELLETYATEAGTDSVRLNATVNPLGIPATAYFEYVDDARYQADLTSGGDGFAEATRTPDIDTGSGNEPKVISAQLSGLVPGATYHYRAVVANASASEEGPERTVTTFPLPTQPSNACPNVLFRTGPSAFLPDCRAYEMVSPVDKNGGDIKVLVSNRGYASRLDQSADSGDAFTYSSVTAFAGALSAPWSSQYMARRGSDGWSTEAINPKREAKSVTEQVAMKFDVQYKMFSSDLADGWLSHDSIPLDECAPEGFVNIYHRDNISGSYESLIPVRPKNLPPEGYRVELQGLSADSSHAVIRANAKLTKDASSAVGVYQLYEYIRDPEGETCGQMRLVSIRPNGAPASDNSSAGLGDQPGEYREGTVVRAMSADGTRIFFSLTKTPVSRVGSLFVRVNSDQPQSALGDGKCTEVEKGCTLEIADAEAQFWTAAANGSRVIYSVGGDELFEYDVDRAWAGESAKNLIAADADGMVGTSEDASRVYFVSREVIEGEGEPGEPNLYLYEPGQSGPERYRLVTVLSIRDLKGFQYSGFAVAARDPIRNGVRVSPDGSHLAFVSNRSLTGYDNTDVADGRPALEVYLYDADSEELRCISCNPSGARPRGREFGPENGVIRRVSAQMPPGENQTFAPHVLAEDGSRLFFESFDALLARDTNGKADAYEWERASSQADCDAMGAELYVPASGGCLSLISSGKSPVDTEIADATPDGASVFLRTAESLLPQDPGQVDVYVARVNGGFPQPPAPPAACEGEACQGPIVPPNDPTPGSLLFQGAGNITEKVTKPRPRCPKGKVRRKGRCVKKHHPKRAQRANENRRQGR